MARKNTITVYWDGQCPFCAALAERLRQYDTEQALRLVDYHDASVAATALPRFSVADLDREMHASLSDGTWRIGYFAWAAVLIRLPRWRLLGHIMEAAIFADIGPKLYRWVAARRLTLSRLLGLPAPCTHASACRLPV
jgi:predicted DCC family thiol-disulfide oxidoreductase YuxK